MSRSPVRAAFTLVEMLVVMAVIGVLLVVAVPAVTGVLRGTYVTQATQAFVDSLSSARQQSISLNRPVEVRMLKFADPSSGDGTARYGALRFYEITGRQINGQPEALPTGPLQRFAPGVALEESAAFSSLMALPETTPGDKLPGGTAYVYRAFQFRPDGSTDLDRRAAADGAPVRSSDPNGLWFATLRGNTDPPAGTTPPKNYATIQIDPTNGAVRVWRR